MKKDILTEEDVKFLVDHFYDKIAIDPLLGGIFHGALGDNWQPHLSKMYRFWETILLNKATYSGRPFAPHATLPIQSMHFDQWLSLFYETIEAHFEGENAMFAMKHATKMGTLFQNKLNYLREN